LLSFEERLPSKICLKPIWVKGTGFIPYIKGRSEYRLSPLGDVLRQFAFPQRLKPQIKKRLSTYGLKPVRFKEYFLTDSKNASPGAGSTVVFEVRRLNRGERLPIVFDLPAHPGLLSDTSMQGATNNHLPFFIRRMAVGLLLISAVAQAAIAIPLQSGIPRTQKHETRHEIDQLEDIWCNALLRSNVAAMDALLADDFMAITSSGTLQTRDQALASLRSGQTHFTAINISERKVRFYRTTALVTSLAQVKGTAGGHDISGSYRYTRVYVRDDKGKWKVVSFEASRIRDSEEHK
jgi:ketosteroid isomerase-like protein